MKNKISKGLELFLSSRKLIALFLTLLDLSGGVVCVMFFPVTAIIYATFATAVTAIFTVFITGRSFENYVEKDKDKPIQNQQDETKNNG
jgi:hypothetical protein